MKTYEWNIGMAATIPSNNGYNLKSWVIEEIIKDQPDIIVLTEFVVSRGIDYFFEVLEKNNYHWFISSSTKQNGILIALKESYQRTPMRGFVKAFGSVFMADNREVL